MADWLTHLFIAYATIELVSIKKLELRKGWPFLLFLFGAVLPDIQTVSMFLGEFGNELSPYLVPFHTPLGLVVLAATSSFLFKKEVRKKAFTLIALGGLLHLLVDFFVVTLTGKVMLFYPFCL